MISAALLLADAVVTLLWQEPLTAVIPLVKRSEVDKRFLSYTTARLFARLSSVQPLGPAPG